jgi:predicted PurR-regulated permease PerM
MTAGYYIAIQQIENNLIVPKIMHENADVNPLIGILGILTGFKLGGVIGGLLAIPVYILARTIYSYYRKYEDKLKPDW